MTRQPLPAPRGLCTAALLAGMLSGAAPAQVPPDQAAEMVLDSARKAYNERQYDFAAARFREFLQKYGGHPKANDARYGLALALLDAPQKDHAAALEQLRPLAGNPQFPEHAYALYHTGLAQRGLGLSELAQAAARPNEAAQRRAAANQRFGEAERSFAAAAAAFQARIDRLPEDEREKAPEIEWAARSHADRAEMLLRLDKPREARAAAEPLLTGKLFVASRYRPLGLYYHGFASFLLGDHPEAGRSLTFLAPYEQPDFGTHARYLVGRILQAGGEHAEAELHFRGVIDTFERQKKEAAEALQQPARFRNDPAEKARLEALANGPPPDHVAAALLALGVLEYEAGKFADALSRFRQFAKDFPKSPYLPDAQLRIGFCQVRLKQFPEAAATLTPLVDSQPALADQAQFWLAKAQAGAALATDAGDPAKAPQRENALKNAVNTFRAAAERANQLAASDPGAKRRRGEILLETADVQQLVNMHREAAGTYEQVLNEKLLPEREPELLHRLASAWQLAGDIPRSEQFCRRFEQQFAGSPLAAAVRFRTAENAYLTALAAKQQPNRSGELPRLFGEAAERYRRLVERYPEFEHAHLARLGLAMCHMQLGEHEQAEQALGAIPAPDRTGGLARVPYLLADCLLRQVPAQRPDDALADNMAREKLDRARQALEEFTSANAQAPEAPNALLKLGYCLRRLALREEGQARTDGLNASRGVFERVLQQYPQHALMPRAVFERAKTMELQGDKNGAANELRRFLNPPLQQAADAPMALTHLATLLREQNKAAEAAQVLDTARQRYENTLNQQGNKEWVALLRYHHGVALQESGKLPEARSTLESVLQVFPNTPVAAEAALRAGQCRAQEGRDAVAAARAELAKPNLNPQQQEQFNRQLQNGFNVLREAGQLFERRAAEFRGRLPDSPARARMLYEAAWAYREIGDGEAARAREQMRRQAHQKLLEEAKKKTSPGATPQQVPVPEVARSAVPVQPSENKARQVYQALVAGFGDRLIGIRARFELAEMFAEREEHGAAVKLLREALDAEALDALPGPELTDPIRIRLGCCLTARKEYEPALAQFDVVAGDPKSPLAAQAHYRAGECLLARGDAAGAAARFAVFRDRPEFQNVPGLTDRALLRLGHALAEAREWDASRQALEQLIGRFGSSPWVPEARYGIGWALQNQGRHDDAVSAYNQVIAATATRLAAKAHLQIGLCRLEQKRYAEAANALLVVPFTFDEPDLNAVALTEAARAFAANRQPEQAERLLRRVLRDEPPESERARAARQRLGALTKE